MTTDDHFGGINGLPYGDEQAISGLNLQLKSFAEIADSLHEQFNIDVEHADLMTNYVSSMQSSLASESLANLALNLGLSLKSPEVLAKLHRVKLPEMPKIDLSGLSIPKVEIPKIKTALDGAGFKLSIAMLEVTARRFVAPTDALKAEASAIVEQDIETVANVLALADEDPASLEEAFRPLDQLEIQVLTGVVLSVVLLVSVLMPEVLTTLGLLGAYQSLLEIVKKLAS